MPGVWRQPRVHAFPVAANRPRSALVALPTYPKMKTNVGGIDRILRFIAGLVLLGGSLYYKSWWGLLCIPILLSAVFGFCGAYLPFGLSSAKSKPSPKP